MMILWKMKMTTTRRRTKTTGTRTRTKACRTDVIVVIIISMMIILSCTTTTRTTFNTITTDDKSTKENPRYFMAVADAAAAVAVASSSSSSSKTTTTTTTTTTKTSWKEILPSRTIFDVDKNFFHQNDDNNNNNDDTNANALQDENFVVENNDNEDHYDDYDYDDGRDNNVGGHKVWHKLFGLKSSSVQQQQEGQQQQQRGIIGIGKNQRKVLWTGRYDEEMSWMPGYRRHRHTATSFSWDDFMLGIPFLPALSKIRRNKRRSDETSTSSSSSSLSSLSEPHPLRTNIWKINLSCFNRSARKHLLSNEVQVEFHPNGYCKSSLIEASSRRKDGRNGGGGGGIMGRVKRRTDEDSRTTGGIGDDVDVDDALSNSGVVEYVLGVGRWTLYPWGVWFTLQVVEEHTDRDGGSVSESNEVLLEYEEEESPLLPVEQEDDEMTRKDRLRTTTTTRKRQKQQQQKKQKVVQYTFTADFHENSFGTQPKFTQGTIVRHEPTYVFWDEVYDGMYHPNRFRKNHRTIRRRIRSTRNEVRYVPPLRSSPFTPSSSSSSSSSKTKHNWFRPVVGTFSGIGVGIDTADLSYSRRSVL